MIDKNNFNNLIMFWMMINVDTIVNEERVRWYDDVDINVLFVLMNLLSNTNSNIECWHLYRHFFLSSWLPMILLFVIIENIIEILKLSFYLLF